MTMTKPLNLNQPPTELNPFDRIKLASDLLDLMEMALQNELTIQEKAHANALMSFLSSTYLLDILNSGAEKLPMPKKN